MSYKSTKKLTVEGAFQHELEIPQTWEYAKFNDVIEIIGGSQPPKSDFYTEYAEDRVRLIQIRDYKSDKNIVFIPKAKAKRFVDKDDVMIGRYGPPIFQILRGLEGAYNVALMKAKPRDNIFSNNYLFYYLKNQNLFRYVEAASDRTAGQSGVNKKHLEQYPVGVPPLPEQKRIVEKLDSLLAQVEIIQQRLNNLPDIIKRFRQSVLAAAVSGKLTAQWRSQNQQEKWQWLTIGDVSTVSTGSTPKRTEPTFWDSNDVPWLTSSVTGKEFCNSATQFVSNKAVKESRLKVFPPGTLLLAMYGEGKTRGQVTEISFEATCNQACAAILVNENKISKSFVKLRLLENYEATRMAAEGGNQPNLNLSKVRKITIPVPSIEEQTEIVRLVEQYFALADTLEKHLADAKARVDNLTQSILAKAFRGELVPQDPNDEPADKLLERIKAARLEAENLEKAAKKAAKVKR